MRSSVLPAPTQPSTPPPGRNVVLLRVAQALVLLFIFLVGINGLGTGFKALGSELLDSFWQATSNPFVGLMVGILATTLVQSSSVTTSMIVVLVAADPEHGLSVASAIPMVMGANIGTTVTNTLVALGHIGRPEEFRRAFAAATCHDFFNWIIVAIFLPLEIFTGFFAKASHHLAAWIGSGGGGKAPNPIKIATKAIVGPVQDGINALVSSERVAAVLLIIVSAVVIFTALLSIVRVLRDLTATRLQVYITKSLEWNPYVGIVVGIILTVMAQSSSITTSVLVPLAGAGIVTVRHVFPITLGANIGTTVTALLASLAVAKNAEAALQIALVHLLFNVGGVLIIYPWKVTREVPIRLAERLANVAVRSKVLAILYVLGLFYGVPAVLVAATRLF